MKNLAGLYPAQLTPFDGENRIDKAAIRAMVARAVDKGMDGFYVGGTTAEAFLLTTDERKELLEIFADACKGRCKLIAHIGSISTAQAVELAEHAQSAGVDAISALPPFYYKYSFDEITDYYFDIANSVDTPVFVYNIPVFTGVTLTAENVAVFFDDERFVGIKHSSPDFYALEQIKSRYPGKLVFTGSDETFLSGQIMGADGGVGSTYNIMPEKFVLMKKYLNEGKNAEALKLQAEANNVVKALEKVGVIRGEKAVMTALGIPFGHSRRPFRPLESSEVDFLLGVCRENGIEV